LVGTAEKLATSSKWEYDGSPYWTGEVDCCINSYTLANGAWLGADVSHLATWFLEHQLEEGGWNCEWVDGSSRASFHSTLNSLRGILWYEMETGRNEELSQARHRAQEYLLERELLYKVTTSEQVGPWVNDLAYPFRWCYSALRALDYLREASLFDGQEPDPRAAQAIELVRSAPKENGRWIQSRRYPGETWFDIDAPVGEPSPWLTFYATRVLKWWDESLPGNR
jgi:hypothetical protein